MNLCLKIILILFFMSFPYVHGMEVSSQAVSPENNLDSKNDTILLVSDDTLGVILQYLNPPSNIDDLCNLCIQLENVSALNVTCKRINKITQQALKELIATIKSDNPKFFDGALLGDESGQFNLVLMDVVRRRNGSSSLIKFALAMGADINYCNSVERARCKDFSVWHNLDNTPLVAAIQSDRSLKIIKLLVKLAADVNKSDGHGETPLGCAIGRAYYDQEKHSCGTQLIKLLIRNKVSVTSKSLEKVVYALNGLDEPWYKDSFGTIEKFYKKIGGLLIKHGANPNGTDPKGKPLVIAADCKQIGLMKFFIEQGADVDQAIQLGQQGYGYENHFKLNSEAIALLRHVDAQVKGAKKEKNAALPDDYDSDDSSSSSSESESDHLSHQPPHVPDFKNDNKKDVTAIFTSLCANKLLTISGAVIVGGICYWAYKKYQAYRATQKEEDEEKENNEEVIVTQSVEQMMAL